MSVLIFDSQAAFYARELERAVPGLGYGAATTEAEAFALAPEAEVLVALAPRITPALVAAAPKLRWIQALTSGVDNLLGLNGPALTSCRGIHGPQMTELAVLLMLASLRRFPAVLANQQAKKWSRWPQPMLAGKTACILGLGTIAEHLAGVLGAFGMQVTGVSDGRSAVPGFARVHRRAALHEAVAEADFLIVLTPYSAATHHIVDARVIAAMRPSAHLINLSRGGCVDEDAVLAALRETRIAGAALDVFATEPLPADSPLWSAPGLIVTPHIGGFSDLYHEQALPAVIANMADYAAGGVAALTERLDR